jgi:hypothetical protein
VQTVPQKSLTAPQKRPTFSSARRPHIPTGRKTKKMWQILGSEFVGERATLGLDPAPPSNARWRRCVSVCVCVWGGGGSVWGVSKVKGGARANESDLYVIHTHTHTHTHTHMLLPYRDLCALNWRLVHVHTHTHTHTRTHTLAQTYTHTYIYLTGIRAL